MPYFSLKRTLLCYLIRAVSAEERIVNSDFTGFLHKSGKSSLTLLRIRKSPCFCHPNIPVKNTDPADWIVYTSAISRKLEKGQSQSCNQIATDLIRVLKNASKPLSVTKAITDLDPADDLGQTFTIQLQPQGFLTFHLSAQGLEAWLQKLVGLGQLAEWPNPTLSISPDMIWQLQYAHGRCHSLLRSHNRSEGELRSPSTAQQPFPGTEQAEATVPELVQALVRAVDVWELEAPQGDVSNLDQLRVQRHLLNRVLAVSMAFRKWERWSSAGNFRQAAFSRLLLQATQAVLARLTVDIGGGQLPDEL